MNSMTPKLKEFTCVECNKHLTNLYPLEITIKFRTTKRKLILCKNCYDKLFTIPIPPTDESAGILGGLL